jgi:hypothetical protein
LSCGTVGRKKELTPVSCGVLAQHAEEILRHAEQALRVRVGARLQVELEAARGAQAADRRRV